MQIRVLFLVLLFQFGFLQDWKVAFLADLHIGNTKLQDTFLEGVVDEINGRSKEENIKFVMIAGDMVLDSIEDYFKTTKSILEKLNIPYFVVQGNHDYGMSEKTRKDAERLFDETYSEALRSNPLVKAYGPEKVDNKTKIYQNYYIFHNGVLFFFLDWNFPTQTGTMCGGEAIPATLKWLERQFESIISNKNSSSGIPTIGMIQNIIFVQHHPFHKPTVIYADYFFNFVQAERDKIHQLMMKYPDISSRYWGVFVGHLHYLAIDQQDWNYVVTKGEKQVVISSTGLYADFELLTISASGEISDSDFLERIGTRGYKAGFILIEVFWYCFLVVMFIAFLMLHVVRKFLRKGKKWEDYSFGVVLLMVFDISYWINLIHFTIFFLSICCGFGAIAMITIHICVDMGFIEHYFNLLHMNLPPVFLISKFLTFFAFFHLFDYFNFLLLGHPRTSVGQNQDKGSKIWVHKIMSFLRLLCSFYFHSINVSLSVICLFRIEQLMGVFYAHDGEDDTVLYTAVLMGSWFGTMVYLMQRHLCFNYFAYPTFFKIPSPYLSKKCKEKGDCKFLTKQKKWKKDLDSLFSIDLRSLRIDEDKAVKCGCGDFTCCSLWLVFHVLSFVVVGGMAIGFVALPIPIHHGIGEGLLVLYCIMIILWFLSAVVVGYLLIRRLIKDDNKEKTKHFETSSSSSETESVEGNIEIGEEKGSSSASINTKSSGNSSFSSNSSSEN